MYSYTLPYDQMVSPMQNKILVVDDDPDILEALRVLLEDQGFSVETASNGNILQNGDSVFVTKNTGRKGQFD